MDFKYFKISILKKSKTPASHFAEISINNKHRVNQLISNIKPGQTLSCQQMMYGSFNTLYRALKINDVDDI